MQQVLMNITDNFFIECDVRQLRRTARYLMRSWKNTEQNQEINGE